MTDTDTQAVTPAALHAKIRAGEPVRILDIRDRTTFEQWRITGDSATVTHLPRMKLLQAKAQGTVDDLVVDIDGEGPITVVCEEGRSSAEVADFLTEAGHDAHNLAEGMEGWADLYIAEPVESAGAATVVQYQRPSSGCLGYLVVAGDEALVIDPLAAFTDRYRADAESHGATLTAAFDTHVHADHVSGLSALADEGVRAVVPEGTATRGSTLDAETVADGETLSVGSLDLDVVHAPGHTTDMTALYGDGVLFGGDSLFVESVARPDLEADADGVADLARELHATIHRRFDRFSDETVLAPGHYSDAAERAADGTYTATLGSLRERLRLFGLDEAAFVEAVCSEMPPQPANYERLIEINLGRETVPEEEAFELELGPNNCAAAAD